MKLSLNPTLPFLALLALANSCQEQHNVDEDDLRINFKLLTFENRELNALPAGSSLSLNFESNDGGDVISFPNQPFNQTESGFVTTALALPGSNYVLSDLILVNDQDEIIYATPKVNSMLAKETTVALPVSYSSSAVPTIPLLDVRNRKPVDFGYKTFKNSNLHLKIKVSEKGGSKPVAATAYLLNGADTVAQYNLNASQNHISIPDPRNDTYHLSVAKDGFAPHVIEVSAAAIASNLFKKPIKIVLEPVFTMLAYFDSEYDSPFQFDFGGPEQCVITIHWGDGTEETYTFTGLWTEFYHDYPETGNYPVTITGDLHKITSFYSYYGQGMIDAIDFRHLTDLREIRFGLTRSPAVLDLSHNTKLNFLNLAGLLNTESIRLPENHAVQYIGFEGPNEMTTASLDALIDNLYKNTISKNIKDGSVGWSAFWHQDEDDFSIVGPPSEATLAKVKIMKETYGWGFYPDPFDQSLSSGYRTKANEYKNARSLISLKKGYKSPYQLDLQTRNLLKQRLVN